MLIESNSAKSYEESSAQPRSGASTPRYASTHGHSDAAEAGALGPSGTSSAFAGPSDQAASSDLFASYAESGISSDAGALPHKSTVERSFGRDLSFIRAHVGGQAATAAKMLGAQAYATGNDVAFSTPPDLHTAAHEAAHVVQQHQGVMCKGDGGMMGTESEQAERQADAIADRVVAGQSAADLFAAFGMDDAPIKYNGPLPRRAVQRKKIQDGVSRDQLNAAGFDIGLKPKETQAAAHANNKRWDGKYRTQLIGFLRREEVTPEEKFSASDAQLIARIQAGAGAKIDGILDDGSMAVLLHAGFKFSDDVSKDKAHPDGKLRASEVTLEFWPGELEDLNDWDKAIQEANQQAQDSDPTNAMRLLRAPEGVGKIYVKVGGKLIAKYDARGGPPRKVLDFGGHTADPTQGSFTIGRQEKGFTTSSWDNSKIPWGSQVRKGTNGYEYKPEGGKEWLKSPVRRKEKNDPREPVPVIDDAMFNWLPEVPNQAGVRWYDRNDFGAMAYRLQGSPGFYVHTTPETEEQVRLGKDVELAHSHGCVHVNPKERDEMIAHGYLQPGVRFVCKKYDQHLLPESMRDRMMDK